jgi:hypothetical protein
MIADCAAMLYNLSDERSRIQRMSVTRFSEARVGGTAFWMARRGGCSVRRGLIERLFERERLHCAGRPMIDAPIVPVPKQCNSREDNEAVKVGKLPDEWEKKPAKKPPERQGRALDQEARQELLRPQEPCECGCQEQG